MLLKLLVISCCIAISVGTWKAPERCLDHRPYDHAASNSIQANFVANIQDAAVQQNQLLQDTYKKYTFIGEPVLAQPIENQNGCAPGMFKLMALSNCMFETNPQLLHSVDCGASACQLSHTASTVDSYNADRCHDLGDHTFIWGTKQSSQNKTVYEMSGEEIDDQKNTYYCTNTEERITTASVKCSNPAATSGQLQLYNLRTDMKCELGYWTMLNVIRDGNSFAVFSMSDLTYQERDELTYSSQTTLRCASIILDTDSISNELYKKIMEKVPLYNPYTDLFTMTPETVKISYYDGIAYERSCYKTIPFTDMNGNSANQFACAMK